MTDRGHKVLAGFVRLADGDRDDVTEAINHFLSATPRERVALRHEFEEAVMGPVHSGCPCCQRAADDE
ncbi:hypothetical protein K8I85_09740 [bacterium]|nr:hypothetical protein [bacterium]